MTESLIVDDADDTKNGEEDDVNQSPNELHVNVLRGKDLLAMDFGGTSDPWVQLKLQGRKQVGIIPST